MDPLGPLPVGPLPVGPLPVGPLPVGPRWARAPPGGCQQSGGVRQNPSPQTPQRQRKSEGMRCSGAASSRLRWAATTMPSPPTTPSRARMGWETCMQRLMQSAVQTAPWSWVSSAAQKRRRRRRGVRSNSTRSTARHSTDWALPSRCKGGRRRPPPRSSTPKPRQ